MDNKILETIKIELNKSIESATKVLNSCIIKKDDENYIQRLKGEINGYEKVRDNLLPTLE